jgi:alpha-1,2-glucosyltransferase
MANSFVTVIKRNVHVIVLDILFVVFLVKNNFSVVLGDKTAHSMVLHLAQINHLLIFILFFFPWLNLKLLDFLKSKFWTVNNLLRFLIIFSILSTLIYMFNEYSYTHNFLFADNRHYSFYYFSKIYLNTWLRMIILTYTSLIFSLHINDNPEVLKDTTLLSWLICTVLALVPAKLFEFRYFTVSMLTLILIIHKHYPRWRELYQNIINKYNIAWMCMVNLITIVVFLYKPFKNSFMEMEVSRFMW